MRPDEKQCEFLAVIETDEGIETEVEVWYRVRTCFFQTYVADVQYRLTRATRTPIDIIRDQIEHLIAMRYGGVEFLD